MPLSTASSEAPERGGYTEDTVTMSMKITWGIIAVVIIGGAVYMFASKQVVLETQNGRESLTEVQKLELLENNIGKGESLTEAQKLKLLNSNIEDTSMSDSEKIELLDSAQAQP